MQRFTTIAFTLLLGLVVADDEADAAMDKIKAAEAAAASASNDKIPDKPELTEQE